MGQKEKKKEKKTHTHKRVRIEEDNRTHNSSAKIIQSVPGQLPKMQAQQKGGQPGNLIPSWDWELGIVGFGDVGNHETEAQYHSASAVQCR